VKNYEYTNDQKNDEGESHNGDGLLRLVQTCHIPNLFEPHSEQNLDVSLKYGAPHSSQTTKTIQTN
jgi:hypothetical protein